MNRFWIISIVVGLIPCMDLAADEPKHAATVKELFADFDLGHARLDTKIIRE